VISEFVEPLRPLLTSLVLPPVPFLALVLLGAWLALRKKPLRKTAALLFMISIVGLWASSTHALGEWLERKWVGDLKPLSAAQVATLQGQNDAIILVLGGGRMGVQPETGLADLTRDGVQRVRYGVWLHQQTGLKLGYSGGIASVAWSEFKQTEAEIAAHLLKREYGLEMAVHEGKSRFTQESAQLAMPMLATLGIKRLVLVTQAYHMPRSLRAFQAAALPVGIEVVPAPMAFAVGRDKTLLDYTPSTSGFLSVSAAWREMLGYAVGR
jgi:uncharacterized SAM-binding protein YcdF (DUF218 family)